MQSVLIFKRKFRRLKGNKQHRFMYISGGCGRCSLKSQKTEVSSGHLGMARGLLIYIDDVLERVKDLSALA
jgi:hypothetical protein